MQNKLILITVFLLMVIAVLAQENVIKGKVADAQTKEPIPAIVIRNKDYTFVYLSGMDGGYKIDPGRLTPDDSLIIEGMCYERICLTFKQIGDKPDIYLRQKIYEIPEISILSKINWKIFLLKVYGTFESFQPFPFELDFRKTITITENGDPVNVNNFEGSAHYEGIDLKSILKSPKNCVNIWYVVNKFEIGTNNFIHFSRDKAPYNLFNQLETGYFVYGIGVDMVFYDYKFEDLLWYGNDSVLVVKTILKNKPSAIRRIKSTDRFLFHEPLAIFQSERFFYIRKRDLHLLQVKFTLTNCEKSRYSTLVSTVEKVEGTIGIEYIGSSICPKFFDVSYYYKGVNNKNYVFTEKTYMDNFQKIKLSDAELESKYGISGFYGKYPGREVAQNKLLRGFFDVPLVK
jgi:hypothetical protein